ncbi:MAG: sulfurtransferase, partial [Myxococcales bacterium]|nr:sulfurtransferase [Myxococcales bacterium]
MNRTLPLALLILIPVHGCGGGTTGACMAPCSASVSDAGSQEAGQGDASASPPGTPVLSGAETEQRLGSMHILDIRPKAAFDAGHLPAARWVDPGAFRSTRGGVSGQVLEPTKAKLALSPLGLSEGEPIIVYGDATSTEPARMVWTLQYYGFDDVALLDGGFDRWIEEQRTVETEPASVTPNEPNLEPNETIRVEWEWVRDHLEDPGMILVDARSEGEYSAGHIPGARNINWQTMVSGGSFLPRSDIADLYAGIAKDKTVIAYCQTGSRGSATWVALRWLGY